MWIFLIFVKGTTSGTVTNTVISKNYSLFIDRIFAIKKSQENEA